MIMATTSHTPFTSDSTETVTTSSQRTRGPQAHHSITTGAIHINKSIRKVNSAFQVLPAGTFGTPSEFLSSSITTSQVDEEESEKSKPRRLSKIQRSSTSRPPTREPMT